MKLLQALGLVLLWYAMAWAIVCLGETLFVAAGRPPASFEQLRVDVLFCFSLLVALFVIDALTKAGGES